MLNSCPSRAGKYPAPLWFQEGRGSACRDRTQAQGLPAPASESPTGPLPSHLLASLGPGSRCSQSLEAAESLEHASV